MNESIAFFEKGLALVVYLSLPALGAAVIVGVVVSLLQSVLSMQDQSLPFSVKLLAVGVTLVLVGPWIGGELLNLGEQAMRSVAMIRVAPSTR